jgi:hypothetical protein
MAGYSGTPLLKKLGIKANTAMQVLGAPGNYFDMLGELPDRVTVNITAKKDLDFIHIFLSGTPELVQLDKLKDQIKKDGTIWVSWNKLLAKKTGNLNENLIREKALAIGLVDVKVCAVDDTWSGLKLVWRKENR